MRAVGLDISLSSTGYADYDTNQTRPFWTRRITSPPQHGPGGTRAMLAQRHDRMRDIGDRIIQCVFRDSTPPNLVVVEGPSMGSIQGAHDISGNWWRIVARLLDLGIPVVEVPPTSLKRYATGSGSSRGPTKVTKHMVVEAVNGRYDLGPIHLGPSENDKADAVVLAAIGLRVAGFPVDLHIPAPNLDALTKIRLPEGLTTS